MALVTKRCRCGHILQDVSARQQFCGACRKKKLAEGIAMKKLLQAETTTGYADRSRPKNPSFKNIGQCVREADALGLSYGQYVAYGLDQVEVGTI